TQYRCISVLYTCRAHRQLPSFPTRRSSDLPARPTHPLPDPHPRLPTLPPSRQPAADRGLTRTTKGPATRRGPEGRRGRGDVSRRSEEHTSELQSRENLVCRLLLEKKKTDES